MPTKRSVGRPRTGEKKEKLEPREQGLSDPIQSPRPADPLDRSERGEAWEREYAVLMDALRNFVEIPWAREKRCNLIEEEAGCFLSYQARHNVVARFKREGWPRVRIYKSLLRDELMRFELTKRLLEGKV